MLIISDHWCSSHRHPLVHSRQTAAFWDFERFEGGDLADRALRAPVVGHHLNRTADRFDVDDFKKHRFRVSWGKATRGLWAASCHCGGAAGGCGGRVSAPFARAAKRHGVPMTICSTLAR